MNNSIADCWGVILRTDPALLNHRLRPLASLEPCMHYFGLSPMQLDGETLPRADIPAVAPGFKPLTDDILLSLRQHLVDRSDLTFVDLWAEKLLRFVELRRRSLRSRAVSKCGHAAAARLHVLHVACFLMDYAAFSRDVRFLNTALKIADMGWVLHRQTIMKNLSTRDDRFIAALFQFRLVLMSEWAIARLRQGGTL